MGLAVFAQPTLIGAHPKPGGGTEIIRWYTLDSTSVETFPTSLQGYFLASSVFDAFSSNYYLAGVTTSGECL